MNVLCGLPYKYLAYFTAIYNLFGYGLMSVLALYEIYYNKNSQLIPLYLLLVGYLTLSVLSFHLIIAIYKSYNGLMLCWLVTLSVFILPEIALHIILAETIYHWFSTTKGSFLLSSTITRNLINIPCIALIYSYYKQQVKRDQSLKRALNPIKSNILNGDLLKTYQNIELNNRSSKDHSNMYKFRHEPETLNGLHLVWNGDGAEVIQSTSISTATTTTNNSQNSSKFTSPPRYSNIMRTNEHCLSLPSSIGSLSSSRSNKCDVLKEEQNYATTKDEQNVQLANKRGVNLNAHFMYLPPAPTIASDRVVISDKTF